MQLAHPREAVGPVALVGVGRMGIGMLRTLRRAGWDVHAWDRDVDALAAAAAAGAVVAPSAAAALADADVVLVSLPHGVVEQALCGDGGLADSARPGAVIVDTSTLAPPVAVRVEAGIRARGAAYLAVPVSGGAQGAETGELIALAGGDRAAFERARPLIETIAGGVFHLGSVEAGSTVKLVHQALFWGSVAMFAEGVRALDGSVDVEAAVAALAQCVGRNNAVASYGRNVVERDHDTGQFPLASASAELAALSERLADRGLDAPVLDAVTATYERAVDAGHGQRNVSAIAETASGEAADESSTRQVAGARRSRSRQ